VRTRFGPESAKVIAMIPGLEKLNLDYTAIDDEGLLTLAVLPGLKELRLDSGKISDASVPVLSKLTTLKYLNLYHTLVTEKGYGELKKALPECQIVWDRDSMLPNRRGS